MKRTTIVLPDDLAEFVEHEAKRLGISVSELVRRTLRQTLIGTRSHPRPIPWAAIIDDPDMVSGRCAEDELSKSWADDLDRGR